MIVFSVFFSSLFCHPEVRKTLPRKCTGDFRRHRRKSMQLLGRTGSAPGRLTRGRSGHGEGEAASAVTNPRDAAERIHGKDRFGRRPAASAATAEAEDGELQRRRGCPKEESTVEDRHHAQSTGRGGNLQQRPQIRTTQGGRSEKEIPDGCSEKGRKDGCRGNGFVSRASDSGGREIVQTADQGGAPDCDSHQAVAVGRGRRGEEDGVGACREGEGTTVEG